MINCRPVGVLMMEDEAGQDEKIIAVPATKLTRRYEKVENYTDLPEITLKQVEHFFEHYKDLEKTKWVKISGWGDAAKGEGAHQRGDGARQEEGRLTRAQTPRRISFDIRRRIGRLALIPPS